MFNIALKNNKIQNDKAFFQERIEQQSWKSSLQHGYILR